MIAVAFRLAVEYGELAVAYEDDSRDVLDLLESGAYEQIVAMGMAKITQAVESGVMDSSDFDLDLAVATRLSVDDQAAEIVFEEDEAE